MTDREEVEGREEGERVGLVRGCDDDVRVTGTAESWKAPDAGRALDKEVEGVGWHSVESGEEEGFALRVDVAEDEEGL